MSICGCCKTGARRTAAFAVICRVALLLSICAIFGVLHLFVTPFPRRFFCTDQSLKYPMPARSSVPYAICAPAGLAIAALAIVWLEVLRRSSSAKVGAGFQRDQTRRCMRQRWLACLHWLYYFCLGCAATELLTVSAKLALGRHRPYFMEACQPGADVADSQQCNSSVAYPVSICRPVVSAYEFKDAQMSFPSGHTSYSMFVAAFVAGYLQLRLRACPPVRFSLQLGLILAGLSVGYSRVSDYKHHWSDVVAGAALGVAVAVAVLHAALDSAAGQSAGLANSSPTGRGLEASMVDDIAIAVGGDDGAENDDVIKSGPPRRLRLRDQAAIDAEAASVTGRRCQEDEADRDSGNVEDDKTAGVARDANTVARLSNGINNGVV